MFHSERHYRRISDNASLRYERLMEKMIEDIERQEEEQERKRMKRSDDGQSSKPSEEEKRMRIHAEATKRMAANSSSQKV